MMAGMPHPNGSDAGAAVEVEGLVKRFGDFTAVDDVSFAVEPGELFGFLGPNGAGKTTTISHPVHAAAADAAAARASRATTSPPQRDAVRSSIGLVFQEITLDDYLTARREPAVPRGDVRRARSQVIDARMAPLLEMVGLTDRKDQQVRFFSGGMKRRLEIARGLLHAPAVLFLDEPTIGLDPQTRVHIWDYVDELRERESTTMFLTTHYMDEAERCDRIAIIDQGRIVAIDTPNALKASVGADTVTLATADDDARRSTQIARAPRRAGRARPPTRLVVRVARRRGVRARGSSTTIDVRRPQRERAPPEPRRRVHQVHRPRHPRRRGRRDDQFTMNAMTRGFRSADVADETVPAGAGNRRGRPRAGRSSGNAARDRRWSGGASSSACAACPTRIITGLAQPLLFLFVLGAGLANLVGARRHQRRRLPAVPLPRRPRDVGASRRRCSRRSRSCGTASSASCARCSSPRCRARSLVLRQGARRRHRSRSCRASC